MSLFSSMNVSATGMTAQRLRMDTISENIANVNTTRGENGEPYRRKSVVFEEITQNNSFKSMLNSYLNDSSAGGVKVSSIYEDQSALYRHMILPIQMRMKKGMCRCRM